MQNSNYNTAKEIFLDLDTVSLNFSDQLTIPFRINVAEQNKTFPIGTDVCDVWQWINNTFGVNCVVDFML